MDLSDMLLLEVFLFVYLLNYTQGHYRNPLNKYIRHYEGLSYDTELLHSNHQRAKRALSHEDKFLHLDFHAHGRFVSFPRYYPKGTFCLDLCLFLCFLIYIFIYLSVYLQNFCPMPTLCLSKGGGQDWRIFNLILSSFCVVFMVSIRENYNNYF